MRYASKVLGMDRDRVEVWSSVPGCRMALVEGVYRFERDATKGDRRQPAPTPVPENLAHQAIAAGVPLRRDGDLFGGAA